MTFQFSSYLMYTLILPVVVLVVTAPVVVKAAGFLIRVFRERDFSGNGKAMLVGALVLVFCVLPQVYYLIQGSYHLITERSKDAVSVSGTVESITEPSSRFPGLRTGSNEGADIVVDGEQYFAMNADGVEVGDEVTILVMPKSKMILELNENEE